METYRPGGPVDLPFNPIELLLKLLLSIRVQQAIALMRLGKLFQRIRIDIH
jgi:hypothetical protein